MYIACACSHYQNNWSPVNKTTEALSTPSTHSLDFFSTALPPVPVLSIVHWRPANLRKSPNMTLKLPSKAARLSWETFWNISALWIWCMNRKACSQVVHFGLHFGMHLYAIKMKSHSPRWPKPETLGLLDSHPLHPAQEVGNAWGWWEPVVDWLRSFFPWKTLKIFWDSCWRHMESA